MFRDLGLADDFDRSYAKALPEWMGERIVKFTKGLQHPNGYFYHPQWTVEDTGPYKNRKRTVEDPGPYKDHKRTVEDAGPYKINLLRTVYRIANRTDFYKYSSHVHHSLFGFE